MSNDRNIEHDIEVPGTPEEAWQAVATGQGMTGWWIPTTIEERVGGTVEFDFGPGFGTAQGKVLVREPPTRFVYEGSGGAGGTLAYEWRIESRGDGKCVVRLITSGFLTDDDWQAEYDATAQGWKLFLCNLRLYLTHFAGQRCASMMVQRLAEQTPASEGWRALTTSLGLPGAPALGEHVSVSQGPPLAGRVERLESGLMTLLVDAPASGIACVGTESFGEKALPMVYFYLFGAGAEEAVARDQPAWNDWIQRAFP